MEQYNSIKSPIASSSFSALRGCACFVTRNREVRVAASRWLSFSASRPLFAGGCPFFFAAAVVISKGINFFVQLLQDVSSIRLLPNSRRFALTMTTNDSTRQRQQQRPSVESAWHCLFLIYSIGIRRHVCGKSNKQKEPFQTARAIRGRAHTCPLRVSLGRMETCVCPSSERRAGRTMPALGTRTKGSENDPSRRSRQRQREPMNFS